MNNLHKVKQVKVLGLNNTDEINELLDTGDWRITKEGFDQEGNMFYILHKLK